MRFLRPVPRVALAQPEDAQLIAQVLASAWSTAAGLLAERALVELTPDPRDVAAWLRGGFEVYKATLDGRPVGVVRCAFPTGACVIDCLAVDPGHRRRGFGRYLAEHALSRARRAGAPRAWTQVPSPLEDAIRLLRRLGFRPVAEIEARSLGERLSLLEATL